MLTKTILFTVTVTALLGAAYAACPSACNGHGSCGNHDKCSCYANWEGHDCSSKSCPTGRDGLTCSGSGMCDGGAGECSCADGYSGEACQRILCPNDCSGRGSCDTTTGRCSCVGGFSGNDCAGRLCPRGDDPLTHEVENGGDGTVLQESEVQAVTFSAGLGIDGSATLTYTDLYGQGWTTRPFAVGGENHYVLEYAKGSGSTAGKNYIVLQYGSDAVNTLVNDLTTDQAKKIRAALLALPGLYQPANRADMGRSVRVIQRPGQTSHKFVGGIEANTKITFDIFITPDRNLGLDANGGLKQFTAYLEEDNSGTTAFATEANAGTVFTEVRHLNDHSADIKDALEGLPNNVIPSVTVTKALSTSTSTEEIGTYGNTYSQTYMITFSASANSGDQNMLSCDATPCDHDGCANRKVGVASVNYLHHDHTTASPTTASKKAPRINFQGQGYFIISLHRGTDASGVGAFSAGTAYLEWNAGNGVERAEFPIIATAAEVQTSLRGITGWEGVTVALSGGGVTANHAYKVTLASGYDDGGQSPVVGLVAGYGGAAGTGTDGLIIIYDQRFSNSLWLGDITGWTATAAVATFGDDLLHLGIQAEAGDNFVLSAADMGYVDLDTVGLLASYSNGLTLYATHIAAATPAAGNIYSSEGIAAAKHGYFRPDYSAEVPHQTSQYTEDYFPVGSVVEVLDTTWSEHDLVADIPALTYGTDENVYRKFKIMSHVENTHGKPFAKLDSTPTTVNDQDYALKVTSYNATYHHFKNVEVNAAQREIQVISAYKSAKLVEDTADRIRVYINAGKANEEFTELLDGDVGAATMQEAINALTALSGPVTVTDTVVGRWEVTFAAIDGDVPQLSVVEAVDADHDYVVTTTVDGWSLTGGFGARLENVQTGSVINITSQETVTFAFSGMVGTDEIVFSFDGHVGNVAYASAENAPVSGIVSAVESCLDEKGAKLVDIADGDVTLTLSVAVTTSVAIKLPEGMDGTKLDVIPSKGAVGTVTRTINKNNNGRSFKVKRVKHYVDNDVAVSTGVDPDADPATLVATSTSKLTFTGKHEFLAPLAIGDELKLYRTAAATKCNAIAATADHAVTQITAITYVTTAGSETTAIDFAAVSTADLDGCKIAFTRTTIILDSMPDTMAAASTGANVELLVTGPTGSCSVSESVKGTKESSVCSNRGNCDGGSALCVCHEGYSGEACETQTVLV